MAKKNRPSVLKRQREAEKRQRQDRKDAKAERKREKRLEQQNDTQVAPGDELHEDPQPLDPPA